MFDRILDFLISPGGWPRKNIIHALATENPNLFAVYHLYENNSFINDPLYKCIDGRNSKIYVTDCLYSLYKNSKIIIDGYSYMDMIIEIRYKDEKTLAKLKLMMNLYRK